MYDWLLIANAEESDKYCGDGGDLPGSTQMLDAPVEIMFRSDTRLNGTGFSLNFEIFPPVPVHDIVQYACK